MSTKHFFNDPTTLVHTALHSLTLTNPSLSVDVENKIVYQTAPNPSHVSLISGGGSGHEPSFAGFVGKGLLTASVAGTIFASPSAAQIRRAILTKVPSGSKDDKGTLVVVMNYTGDVLNFGMGVEKAKAADRDVEMVIVADDVGVGRKQGGKVGRRGIAGTCLVLKVAGALAATGASLSEVVKLTRLVANNTVSVGSSLSHVHVPGRRVDDHEDELGAEEVEVGMGIHNEPGSERMTTDLMGLVRTMLAQLLDQNDKDRAFSNITKGDKTVLLVNNLGGVSTLEMGGITDEVVRQLEDTWGVQPVRILSGTYMTSLNGLGFSISLLKLQDTGLKQSMLELLDAPAEAVGWSAAVSTKTWETKGSSATRQEDAEDTEEAHPSNIRMDAALAKKALTAGLERVINAEPDITNYDTIVGDGDCGISLSRCAAALLKMLERSKPPDDVAVFLHRVIGVVEKSMDGTSGAIYAIFLNALAHGIRQQSPRSGAGPENVTVGIWARALESGMAALAKYTPAQPGDRTLVDALYPFVGTLAHTGSVQRAAEAARKGAEKTKGMKASLGRAVYVGGEGWQGVPDPGAHGLAEFVTGLSEALK